MTIKFGDLKIGEKAKQYILEAIKDNVTSSGPKVRRFEEGFSKFCGYKNTVCVSSGTSALINGYLSLYDFGAERNKSEVIVPALGFIATSSALRAANLIPKWVDIRRETLNINEDLIENAVTSNTIAICAVSTMGKSPNIDQLQHICKKYNLRLLLDECENHFGLYNGKCLGHYADMSFYSFYVAHILSCGGEGGAVCTENDDIARIIRSAMTHGRRAGQLAFFHDRLGYNSKPSELNFCIGLEQLDHFSENFEIRRNNWQIMREGLKDYGEFVYFSDESPGYRNSPHAFSVVLKDYKYNTEKFRNHLTKNQIEWKLNFLSIPTQQKMFEECGHKLGEFPESEFVGDLGQHWGCHQNLSIEDCNYVVNVVKEYFDKRMWAKI